MPEIESAWPRYPHYRIDISPFPNPVRVRHGDLVLAESSRALLVEETDHKPVLYLPEEDVTDALFRATDHHTVCPFKGQASYRSLVADGMVEENVLWYYPEPFAEVAGIAGHVAFYDSRVRVEFDDPGPPSPDGPSFSVKRFPPWGDIGDLCRLIDVEPVAEGRYRAPATPAFGRAVVDGQQILAAGVVAVAKTVPGQRVSSVQMIFNRAASVSSGLDFAVRVLHGGRTFTSAAVEAHQDGRLCAPGLALLDDGAADLIRHAAPMPLVPGPMDAVPLDMGVTGRDLRVVDAAYTGDPDANGPPEINAWVRFRELPDAQYMHQALVAHSSGLFQIAAAMRPHAGYGEDLAHRTLSTANMAIHIVFHEEIRATEWLLFTNASTHAAKGVTFGTGLVFDEGGAHLASFSVQGMVRPLLKAARAEERGYEKVL